LLDGKTANLCRCTGIFNRLHAFLIFCAEIFLKLQSLILRMASNHMIAVCGLDCESCDIRTAPDDPEAAKRLVAWFKKEGWLKETEGIEEICERSMYCRGCRGDRSVHWTPDCPVLICCVDEKGVEFCYQCDDFPCDQLTKWADQSEQHSHGLNRLKTMKAQER
jgi:hypothetical protein